jgi:hypothetical protein
MLDKIVFAGVNNSSFKQGSKSLFKLAEVIVPIKQVERVCQRIGTERVGERDAEVKAYQDLPLAERKGVPAGVTAPDVAVVGCDGGRLQILERTGASVEAEEASDAEDGRRGKNWRENKIGVLMSMKSVASASDPCPEIPEQFVDPTRIMKLARELKKQAPPSEEAAKETAEPEIGVETLAENRAQWEPPEVLAKDLVGSRVRWPEFGPILAMMAWKSGFYGASRQAFIGDGSDNNWTIWRKHFSSFVPILDFIHGLSYVFAAATAGRPFAEGWPLYVEWIGWVWVGEIEKVIAALAQRQLELGVPTTADGDTSPRQIVARALIYLQNHQEQMRYAEYRRQGLPITSSYVESAVKQFNQRVKGTEKFWSEVGAEAMMQLRGDCLSDHDPMPAFWQNREAKQTGQRSYHMAA